MTRIKAINDDDDNNNNNNNNGVGRSAGGSVIRPRTEHKGIVVRLLAGTRGLLFRFSWSAKGPSHLPNYWLLEALRLRLCCRG
jgi:hypothetical protein